MRWNLGESRRSRKAADKLEEARKWYGGAAVGLSRSRGVAEVMLCADTKSTRRGQQQDAERQGSKCRTQRR
jgi:hypothetical protein